MSTLLPAHARRSRPCALVAVAALVIGAGLARPAHATVDTTLGGVVYDGDLAPAAGAVVVLHDTAGNTVQRATTGPDGRFSFPGVALGDYTVEASLAGHADAHQHVHASSTEPVSVELYCVDARNVFHVVEEAPEARLPERVTGSVKLLDREALRALPKGEDRPITEVLGTQPGFVEDAFGNVYARGNHANIQYQVDGIPIPDSVGNVFAQALPVRLIQDLEIFTGGMPAEFGDRLSAVVNITSRHGGADAEGVAQVRYGSFGTLEPSLSYSRTFGRLGVFVGGSYLATERGLDPPAPTPALHDDAGVARAFLRLDWQESERTRVEVFGTYAWNRFQIPIDPTVTPLDPMHPQRPADAYGNASGPFVPRDTDATETEHEVFVAASLVHALSSRAQLQIAPFYKLSMGTLLGDPAHALGALADPGATASDVARRADHLGAALHYSLHVGNHLLKAGLQGDLLLGDTAFTEYVRDDASPRGGPDRARTGQGRDVTRSLLGGVYVEDRWDRGRLSLQSGVRVDEQHVSLAGGASDDQVGVSPRLGLAFAFRKELVAHAFAGVSWQPPAPLDAANAARALGVLPADRRVPYDVRAETDLYGELGVDARVVRPLRLGATGWGRYAFNQLDDVAIGSTNLIANYNFERGRAVGVEGRADLVLGYWLTAFANVSWEIAQGQGIASAKFLFTPDQLGSTAWQTLDHSQTLTANLGATLHERRAALTVLGAYGSGLRTGPNNDAHVPEHLRVDATLQYAFDDVPLRPRVAIDVINLLDARYAYRIGNGFVGSSFAAPRSVFVRLSFPLDRGGHP